MEFTQYEKSGETDPYDRDMNFTVEEVDVLRALYREKIHTLTRQGTPDRIDGYYVRMASWPVGQGCVVHTANPGETIRELRAFQARTNKAITRITRDKTLVPHGSGAITERIVLGNNAGALATEMEEKNVVFLGHQRPGAPVEDEAFLSELGIASFVPDTAA